MRTIDPGHVYELDWLDGDPYPQVLIDIIKQHPRVSIASSIIFVKREGSGYPGNEGHHPGTNCQEVLRALIDRVKYLDHQVPHPLNAQIIADLRHSIFCFEQRAAERHGRAWTRQGWHDIELDPVCAKCGHIGCVGGCHD